MHRFLISIITVLFIGTNVYAQQLAWEPLGGPRSSDTRDVAVAPNGDVYVISYSNAGEGKDYLYRSTDDGITWNAVYSSTANPFYGVDVAPDGTVYLGTFFGIYRSTDNGALWDGKTGGFGLNYKFHFGENGFIVAGGYFNSKYTNSAYSTDNGITWQVLPPPFTTGGYIVDLALASDGTLYAATYRSGIHKTTDYGATWTEVSDSTTANTWFLAAGDNGRLVALADWSVVVSDDGGTTWSTPGAELGYVSTFTYDGKNQLLAGRDRDSVFISNDLGQSWAPVLRSPVSGNNINAIESDGTDAAYICTAAGMYWIETDFHLVDMIFFSQGGPIVPSRLAVTDNNGLLVSCPEYGLLSTDESGTMWRQSMVDAPIYEAPVAFERDVTGNFYAFTKFALHRSSDNGGRWTRISTLDSLICTPITTIAANGTLYCAMDVLAPQTGTPAGIHRFNSGTGAWLKVDFHTDSVAALAAGDLGQLYAADGEAVYRTTNDGGSWTYVLNGSFSILYSADNGSVYAVGSDGMYKTTDDGATWTELNLQHASQASAMIEDNAGRLFVAMKGTAPLANIDGVYASLDGGATWTEENTGFAPVFETNRCFDLAIDGSGRLIAALEDGVYRTSTATGISGTPAVESAMLAKAYPNPAASGTPVTISYQAATAGASSIRVYSILGEEVYYAGIHHAQPGIQRIRLQTGTLPPGLYTYRVETAHRHLTGKLIIR